MASIVRKKRKDGYKYYAQYRDPYSSTPNKQQWLPCENKHEAKNLCFDIEEANMAGIEFVRSTMSTTSKKELDRTYTVADLLVSYVKKKSAESWEAGTRENILSIIDNYINPFLGDMAVVEVTTHIVQDYYNELPEHKAKGSWKSKKEAKNLSARHVVEIDKILSPAFELACREDTISFNPVKSVELPKQAEFERDQWTEAELKKAFSVCDDLELKVFMGLMSCCTLRSGELSGLDWDCIDVSSEAIKNDEASITINKAIRRLNKSSIEQTRDRHILYVFPNLKANAKSVVVLKGLKTSKSKRKLNLSRPVAELLVEYKTFQDQQIAATGSDYHDYGYRFVFSQLNGRPYVVDTLSDRFKRFVENNNLRMVDAYSLRHTGISTKLRATRDIKAVQHDAGHASSAMILKHYAAIEEEDQKKTAKAVSDIIFSETAQNEMN